LFWERAEQIDTNKCEDIKCYLVAIAKHEAINERNKIRPHVELDENVIGNSAKVFADIELREVIYSALQQLKTEYQIILLKYYYQEKLIASEEGIPESTVKTKLKRGREKLKEILIKECVIDENEL
jgi:DNA-directed RNA polymerase specialized sigma24 family protein